MNRITQKDLEHLVLLINKRLDRPETPYSEDETGHYKANIGNFHLSYAYGGVSLEETRTAGGGVRSVFGCGHVTKRELYGRMQAFLEGIDTGKGM